MWNGSFVSTRPAGRKGVKRKRGDYDSDAAEDEDFVPNAEEEEEEEEVEENEEEKEEEEEAEDFDLDFRTPGKSRANYTINRNSVSILISLFSSLLECGGKKGFQSLIDHILLTVSDI